MAGTQRKYKTVVIAQGCVFKDNKILLIRRNEPESPRLHLNYELPGGKIEGNENPEQAALREILEETGVQAKIDYLIPFAFERARPEKNIVVKVVCYKCSFVREMEERPIDIKVKEAGWYEFNAFSPMHMQTGSLMFFLHALERSEIRMVNPLVSNMIAQLEMISINPQRNRYRQYKIIVRSQYKSQKTFEVVKAWGRIHPFSYSHGYYKAQPKLFSDRDEMLSFVKKTLELRYKHNYKVVKKDETFPKIDILDTFATVDLGKQLKLEL